MARRSVAALVIAATLASLPGCVSAWSGCQNDVGKDVCGSPPKQTSSSRDDHTGTYVLLGVASVAVVLGIIAIVRSGPPHDETKPARPAPIPTVADSRARVFAPAPSGVADEAEQLRLQRMYVQGQVLARAGRCDGAQALGRQIARTSPDYYATYAAEPVIATCGRTL